MDMLEVVDIHCTFLSFGKKFSVDNIIQNVFGSHH